MSEVLNILVEAGTVLALFLIAYDVLRQSLGQ